ncbi:tuftelin interacting protein 11 [Plectosphaerella plurivora]|uniref:Tuftelin interacting protein 11 n=1 Tax=Plectosphaerella plurivora TaxID=936078 RepID=A0A9P9AHS1_9PEZI|nr:tuftelin interacting protein 11 [Plectosphaerella plurivora]
MSNFPTFDPSRLTKKSAAASFSSESESEQDDQDFGGDFSDLNPRKRRRVGNSKEQAALGIFASDSEDGGPGRKWKQKQNLRGKGMSFISTGTTEQPADQEYSDDSNAADGRMDDEDVSEEEEETSTTAGLGFGSSARGGLGFAPAQEEESEDQPSKPLRPSFAKNVFDGSNPLGRGFVPSSARQPVLKEPVNGWKDEAASKKGPLPSAFNAKYGSAGKANPKSFGARMMAKMGYVEGTGLGKEGQGRNVIIEAHLRPQGVGLGAVKEKSEAERKEEKRQAKLKGEVVLDSDEEEKKKRRERKKKLGSGVTSSASTPRRQKTSYMTADEIRKNAPGLQIPDAFAPILDLTGPGSKMLTSTSGLLTPTAGAIPESSETAEARKIVRRAHADLAAFSEEWRNLEERKSWVDLELHEREQEMTDLSSDLSRLQVFAKVVSEQLPSAKTWPDLVACLQQAVQGASTLIPEVGDIAVAAIHPFFRDPDWVLLEQPTHLATELKSLAPLLGSAEGTSNVVDHHTTKNGFNSTDVFRQHQRATTPFETLMYKLWYPKAMTAVRDWDVYDTAPLLSVLEAWDSLLPAFVRAQFIDSIVRKLETAVSEWNPRKKRQSQTLPHVWLFPWLPYLPSYHLEPKGTGLVADVRRKFCQLIDVWSFDRGVVPGLEQWREVMGPQWQPLIMSHVLPSMGRYLRLNFRVDPGDQEPYLSMLTGAMKWSNILGPKVLAQVVVSEVFGLWHDKLGEWLGLEEMNLEEVAAWYEWWRDQVFPAEISKLGAIRKEFDKGSIAIERTLDAMERNMARLEASLPLHAAA